MAADTETDDLVTLRVPRRAAAMLEAHLEVATTPSAIRARLAAIRIVEVLVAIFGFWFAIGATVAAWPSADTDIGHAIVLGFIAAVTLFVAYGIHRTCSARKSAYRAHGLI